MTQFAVFGARAPKPLSLWWWREKNKLAQVGLNNSEHLWVWFSLQQGGKFLAARLGSATHSPRWKGHISYSTQLGGTGWWYHRGCRRQLFTNHPALLRRSSAVLSSLSPPKSRFFASNNQSQLISCAEGHWRCHITWTWRNTKPLLCGHNTCGIDYISTSHSTASTFFACSIYGWMGGLWWDNSGCALATHALYS